MRQRFTSFNESSTELDIESFMVYPQMIIGGRRRSIFAINGGRGHGHVRCGGRFGCCVTVNGGVHGRGCGRGGGNDKFINSVGISNTNILLRN